MSSLHINRIKNELIELQNNPITNCSAGPINVLNITKWQAIIFGPEYTPYFGGTFILHINFPNE
jgi:ubiquitin-protein ligase